MNKELKYVIGAVLLSMTFSCSRMVQLESLQAENIEVKAKHESLDRDEAYMSLNATITPYRHELNEKMTETLAVAAIAMNKDRPESLMGNFVADLLVEEFEEATGVDVDLAITNYGGLRIPVIDSGAITRGDIFELMPFDNTVVLAKVDSAEIMELIRHSLNLGGWPVSKEVQIIREAELLTVMIDGQALQKDKTYHILINNYMASGGDSCFFIKAWEKKEYPYLLRDLIIEYLKEEQAKDKKIRAELSSRIVLFE